jgi:hypothetical protein
VHVCSLHTVVIEVTATRSKRVKRVKANQTSDPVISFPGTQKFLTRNKIVDSVSKHPVAYICSYIKNRRYATMYVITIS